MEQQPADDEHATVVLHAHDPGALSRQAEYRRRYKSADEMCGTGNREGSWRALKRANRVLLVCGKGGCATLCAYTRAVRAANAAGRSAMQPGDGCAARGCSKARRHKAPRHAATQRRWATELQAGTRLLAARPETTTQETAARITGDELAHAIDEALTLLPRP